MSDGKFDKIKYNNNYNKNNYIKPTIRFKPDNYRKIEEFCANNGFSFNDFINRAALYIIDHEIDINAEK